MGNADETLKNVADFIRKDPVKMGSNMLTKEIKIIFGERLAINDSVSKAKAVRNFLFVSNNEG